MRYFVISLVVGFVSLNQLRLNAQTQLINGQALFEKKCTVCHGKDGTKGLLGAKNLQKSTLNDTLLYTTIEQGRRVMPAWGKRLTAVQINSLILYIHTLRKLK